MQFLYPGFCGACWLGHPGDHSPVLFQEVQAHLFYQCKVSERNQRRNFLTQQAQELVDFGHETGCSCLFGICVCPTFLPTGENIKTGDKAVSIYIDNSFSMAAEKENIPLLDLAKERAVKINKCLWRGQPFPDFDS